MPECKKITVERPANENISCMEISRANPFFLSFYTLRKAVGFTGILLGGVLVLGTFLLGDCSNIQYSISHYYYTVMGDVLVGALCAIAFFLMAYPGYNSTDNRLTNIAGLLALFIALFPTDQNTDTICCIITRPKNNIREAIHLIAAGCFFIILSYIAFFQFTKSDKKRPGTHKRKRNTLFRLCGILMFSCILLILIVSLQPGLSRSLSVYKPIFWLEVIALIAFGACWLIKGEFLLRDSPAAKNK